MSRGPAVRHARSTRSALSRQRNSRSGLAPRIACTRMHTSDATPNAKAICRRRGSSIGSSIGSSTAARMPNTPTRMPGGLGPSPTYSRALRGAPRPAAPAQAMLLTISGRAAGRAARAALVSSRLVSTEPRERSTPAGPPHATARACTCCECLTCRIAASRSWWYARTWPASWFCCCTICCTMVS